MTDWQNDLLTKPNVYEMTNWCNIWSMKCQVSEMNSWCNNYLARPKAGEMAARQNGTAPTYYFVKNVVRRFFVFILHILLIYNSRFFYQTFCYKEWLVCVSETLKFNKSLENTFEKLNFSPKIIVCHFTSFFHSKMQFCVQRQSSGYKLLISFEISLTVLIPVKPQTVYFESHSQNVILDCIPLRWS